MTRVSCRYCGTYEPGFRLRIEEVETMEHDDGNMEFKDYCRKINALIPAAEEKANKAINPKAYKTVETYAFAWNRFYHAEMNRTARKAGLRSL